MFIVEESSAMPGTFWVCDTSKPRGSADYRVEWHESQIAADHEAKARNEGKQRVVAPRGPLTEEQKQQRREARERNKKNGTEHKAPPSKTGKQRRGR